jgi:hypothetical protein
LAAKIGSGITEAWINWSRDKLNNRMSNRNRIIKMKPRKLTQKFGIAPSSEWMATLEDKSAGKPLARRNKTASSRPGAITKVVARIDVGLGNALFIRGQGDGLAWDKGTPLLCQNASSWVWSTGQATGKVAFKLLLNDVTWAQGDDIVVEAGKKIEVVPRF